MATDNADNSSSPDSQTTAAHTSKVLVEQGYDIIAPAYLAWSAPRTTTRLDYLNKLFTLLPSGANVLELGCGAGVPCTQALTEQGFNVTAVDISSAQIALARQHVPQATLIHADMMALSFEPESFDAVAAFYSIFHLPQTEQGMMIRRIKGWLKEGGWLLCNFSTDEGDQMMEDWMGAKMFWSGVGVSGNRDMLKKDGEGLDVVEDEVVVEKVGRMEEQFQWVLAVKAQRNGGNDHRAKAG
jgi:ubiquinone/menaquinone biosynthesis C-methylase UbiE